MEQRRLLLDGRERKYIIVTPPEADPRTPRDVVFFFHGSLQSPGVIRRFTNGTFDSFTDFGAVVVYPGGVANHFNDARVVLAEKTRELGVDDVAFTHAILAEVSKEFTVDRVFACGYSNGGQMVLRLLFDAPGLLTAAASFAATLPTEDNFAPTNPLSAYQPTPVLFIHGTADKLAPYEGGEARISVNRTRGTTRSAVESAGIIAKLNGAESPTVSSPVADVEVTNYPGANPVTLWTVEGMGHVVPSGNELDPRIGPNTTTFMAADVTADFFGLRDSPSCLLRN